MKKILVLGSSLNVAIWEFVNDADARRPEPLEGVTFAFASINGRAWTHHAAAPPFRFGTGDGTSVDLVDTATTLDGDVAWRSVVPRIDFSEFAGLMVSETLLWTLFPEFVNQKYFVFDFIGEDLSATHTPLSAPTWLEAVKAYKKNSFALFDFIRRTHPGFPVALTPSALPRLDQTQFDDLYRRHRRAEIACLGDHVEKAFGFVVGRQPEATLASPIATLDHFTKGDMHHFSKEFVGAALADPSMTPFYEAIAARG